MAPNGNLDIACVRDGVDAEPQACRLLIELCLTGVFEFQATVHSVLPFGRDSCSGAALKFSGHSLREVFAPGVVAPRWLEV